MKFINLLLVALIAVISFVPLACTISEEAKQTSPEELVALPPDAKVLGLVFKITGLDFIKLDAKQVRDEFTSALQSKMAIQGYKVLNVADEVDAKAKNVDRALLVNYREERNEPNWGVKLSVIFQGWQSKSGRSPLCVFTAETPSNAKPTKKGQNALLLELRQYALDSFWQEIPDTLLPLLFLDGAPRAQEKWSLQLPQDNTDQSNIVRLVSGNMFLDMLLVHPPYNTERWTTFLSGTLTFNTEKPILYKAKTLNIIDIRSGAKLWEFKDASIIFDDKVILVTSSGQLHCMEPLTGKIRWEYSFTHYSQAATSLGLVTNRGDIFLKYYTVEGSGLVKIDSDTGNKVWEIAGVGVLDFNEDTVFVNGERAIDRHSGKIKWENRTPNTIGQTVTGDIVLVQTIVDPGASGKLYLRAINTRNGEEMWKQELMPELAGFDRAEYKDGIVYEFRHTDSDFYYFDVLGGGSSTYVPAPEYGPGVEKHVPLVWPQWLPRISDKTPYFVMRDAKSGDIIWKQKQGPSYEEFQKTLEFGILLEKEPNFQVSGGAWVIKAIDMQNSSIRWKIEIPALLHNEVEKTIVDIEDCLFFVWYPESFYYSEGNGDLVALDLRNGNEVWRLKSYRDRPITELLGIDESRVLLRVNLYPNKPNNLLYCLDACSGSIIWQKPLEGSFEGMKWGVIILDESVTEKVNGMSQEIGHRLYALDARTGDEKWNLGLTMLWNYPPSARFVLDPEGDWTERHKGSLYFKQFLNEKRLQLGTTLYIETSDSREDNSEYRQILLALDLLTGKLRWYWFHAKDDTITAILYDYDNYACIGIGTTGQGPIETHYLTGIHSGK